MTALIRKARVEPRATTKTQKTQQAYSWPAPTLGLVANGNIAVSQPGAATVLENGWPTSTGVVTRRGSQIYATLGAGSLEVRSIFSYAKGNLRKMFAADDAAIYDITNVQSPINYSVATDLDELLESDTADTFGENSTYGLDVHANTNGKWVVIQFQSSDGDTFLRGVNGTDTPFVYDGVTFSAEPALTFPVGSTAVPEDLVYVWAYKNRHFFIEKESMNVWYLPVGQIGGELSKFSLGGQFKLGGSLLFGATWSRDTGSGLNAMCAFFSSEGEVAVYQGSNPGDANDWSLVGVYRIGKPQGQKSFIDAGGDLVIATDIGLVPLSRALDTDFAILGTSAVSESIVDLWNEEADLRSGEWNVAFWSSRQMVIVALPRVADQPIRWLVANAKTKAWAVFSGWDATCVHVFGKRCFFGGPDGKITEAYVTGLDEDRPYTATVVPAFDQMNAAGFKTVSMARAVFRGPRPVREKITVQSEYRVRLPAPPDATISDAQGAWGTARWGRDVWGEPTERNVYAQWRTVYGGGEVHAPAVQVTSGSIVPLDVELIRIDATFVSGDVVT